MSFSKSLKFYKLQLTCRMQNALYLALKKIIFGKRWKVISRVITPREIKLHKRCRLCLKKLNLREISKNYVYCRTCIEETN